MKLQISDQTPKEWNSLGKAGGGGAGAELDTFDVVDRLLPNMKKFRLILDFELKMPKCVDLTTYDIGGGGGGGFGTLESACSVVGCVIWK